MPAYTIERGGGRTIITFAKAPSKRTRALLEGLGYRYYAKYKCWIGKKNGELIEELLEYRRKEEELLAQQFKRQSNTICWDCANALGDCPWSVSFTPVDGWDAIYNAANDSYCVLDCPEFRKEDRKEERKKPKADYRPA